MPRLIVSCDDESESVSIVVSANETPVNILKHYGYDPDVKIVYVNGEILSREKMKMPFGGSRVVFMAIRNKLYMR